MRCLLCDVVGVYCYDIVWSVLVLLLRVRVCVLCLLVFVWFVVDLSCGAV